MKNLFLTFIFAFSLSNIVSASNIGDDKLSLIKNEKVEFTLSDASQKSFILFSGINIDLEALQFVFNDKVSMIQVFNDHGELDMIVPIGSEKVDLGLSLFQNGIYKLGFMVDGLEEIQYSTLKIK